MIIMNTITVTELQGGTPINLQTLAALIYDANFYVMNSNFQVYKCLDNNNNGQSTIELTKIHLF